MELSKLQAIYGLKFNPFLAEVPVDALVRTPKVESFCYRVESLVLDGGFAMISGDPGMGKSAILRLLVERLGHLRELQLGIITRPQSGMTDFYREMTASFGQNWSSNNRWGSFRGMREKWQAHIQSTLLRPVLLIDEAQEIPSAVLNEIRILGSVSFDSKCILTVILCGDLRLPERLTGPDLAPIGSRIKARYRADSASKDELRSAIEQRLDAAGNPTLMTEGLLATVCDHSSGNYRVLMQTCDELLVYGASKDAKQLDEKLFLDLYQEQQPRQRKQNHRRN